MPTINPALYRVMQFLLTLIFRLYLPTTIRGKRRLPPGPYILVANHSSNLDPLLLGWAMRPTPIYTMAKAELWGVPVVRWLVANLGAFPVDRSLKDTQAMRTSLTVLKGGQVLMIFPEGTFSNEGTPLAMHNGAVRLAVKLHCPIVPAYLDGTYRALPGMARFVRPARLRVIFGRPLDLAAYYDTPLTEERSAAAVAEMERAVRSLRPRR